MTPRDKKRNEELITTFKEYFEKLKNRGFGKPKLKAFDVFDLPCPVFGNHGPNGYVVLPDDVPNDYQDSFYEDIDTNPVLGLTFGGYAVLDDNGGG